MHEARGFADMLGLIPKSAAKASQAWASISNQIRKRFSGSQILAISGRL
jgi:hypothetical protein